MDKKDVWIKVDLVDIPDETDLSDILRIDGIVRIYDEWGESRLARIVDFSEEKDLLA